MMLITLYPALLSGANKYFRSCFRTLWPQIYCDPLRKRTRSKVDALRNVLPSDLTQPMSRIVPVLGSISVSMKASEVIFPVNTAALAGQFTVLDLNCQYSEQ